MPEHAGHADKGFLLRPLDSTYLCFAFAIDEARRAFVNRALTQR